MAYKEIEEPLVPSWAKWGIAGVFGLIAVVALNPLVIVGSGEKGLVFNWGAVQEEVLDQGMHFRVPFMQHVETLTIQPIQEEVAVPVDAGGAITKDNQTVGAETLVYYQYDPTKLVHMWREYGTENITRLVSSALKETFKETIGDYTIFDVAQNQEELRGKVTNGVKTKLANYPVIVTEVRIQNYDWSDAFDKQIQLTMQAAQQVKQKEQELLIAEQEAQKQVKSAEAAKQALIQEAEGEKEAAKLRAEAKALEGEGIKKYNDAIAQNLEVTLKLKQLDVEMEKATHWTNVPQQVYTALPFSMPVK
jgi:regulator of protease activity HflC (stomatin/prohibitin superfamily)